MESFKFFIRQLHSFSGRTLYWNILGMSFISFIESISIFILIPLISISGMIETTPDHSIMAKLFSFTNIFPKKERLLIILGIFMLLIIGQNFIQQRLSIKNAAISQAFIGELRTNTYRQLLKTEWGFFTRNRKSDLIHIMTTELAKVAGGINQFLLFIGSIIFTIIQIGIAIWLSPIMTLAVLLFGFILSLFSRKYIKRSRNLGKNSSLLAQEYLAGITDQLNGIKEIKSNSLELTRLKWLDAVVQGMYNEQLEYMKLKTTSQLFYKISSSILISVFIYLSISMFHAHPEQYLLIIVIFSRLWPRVASIQSSLEQLAATMPAFKELLNLQEECRKAIEVEDDSIFNQEEPMKIEHTITCNHVYFRYNQKEANYALQDVDVTINAREMTAVVGHSGAGKSTLIDILMGLNQPESGTVLVDGKWIERNQIPSLRNSISYVPQDPFLFNASIRENLLMVTPEANEEEIWEALHFSAADDFVKAMPNGLDTIVGDRGVKLSGGERQRLVLARAILKKPSILILDEATSALDSENEARIQESLDRLKGSMTIIMIAHRLSTIRQADQVIVLEHGKVIQQGNFHQLADDHKGMFSSLLKRQIEVVN